MKSVDPAVYPDQLQCPYPGCAGALPEAAVKAEVISCPRCRRLAARCPNVHPSGRCPTLNRALARHCRNCGGALPDAWAQELWAHDLQPAGTGAANGSTRRALALEKAKEPEVVMSFAGRLQFRSWPGNWPLTLVEAAGRLWVCAPDSSYVSVDPFRSAHGPAPVWGEPLWRDVWSVRLRARAAGPWLVLYADHGIHAINLLAVDDPRHREHYSTAVWTAGTAERLASEPVLLRYGRDWPDGLGRLLAWTTHDSEGLWLWLWPLELTAGRRLVKQKWPLKPLGARPLASGEDPPPVVLAAAPLGTRDVLFLCTNQDLWRIDVPAPGSEDKPRLRKLLSKPRFLINQNDVPGLVFVRGPPPAAGEQPRGTLFVAHRDREGPAAEDLLETVTVQESGLVESFSGIDQGGVPLDAIPGGGGRQVLVLAGRTLLRCDAHGNQARVLTSEDLVGTVRGHVYQDVAVCTAFDGSAGQGHWVTMLVDLAENARVADGLLRTESLEAHPVLLGNHFFTLERIAGELCLTRRPLVSR